jgi:hypothetical protein
MSANEDRKDKTQDRGATAQEHEGEEKVVEEYEAELEDHDSFRRENERSTQGDLNQGMQTGTHDSAKLGVNWGPSYRTKRRKPKPNPAPKKP